jgi:hypothetical protein
MRRIFALTVALFLLAGSALPSHAQPAAPHMKKSEPGTQIPKLPPVMTTYEIYVGGLHFLTADILFQEEGGTYKTRMHAHTAGYLYKVLKWDGEVSSTGRIKGDHFEPIAYHNIDTWRDKPKTTELDFDNNGNIKANFDPPNTDQNRNTVTDAQKQGALDPVTALLQMLAHVAIDQDCNVSVPVFDGKRRFDLNGEDKGLEIVDEKDYGIYSGAARLCSVDFNMIAGEWKDREKNKFWEKENGEQGRDAFHIWLASVGDGMPALPVRLESASSWGPIIGHLTNWHYATSAELKP